MRLAVGCFADAVACSLYEEKLKQLQDELVAIEKGEFACFYKSLTLLRTNDPL